VVVEVEVRRKGRAAPTALAALEDRAAQQTSPAAMESSARRDKASVLVTAAEEAEEPQEVASVEGSSS
jgi:hypothetical protein